MGLIATKSVFGVSHKVMLKQVFLVTETSWNNEILYATSLNIIALCNEQKSKVLIIMRGCASWSAILLFTNPKDRFSRIEAQIRMNI